jgi:bacterioferritin (cytochrome b1)
MTAFTSHVTFIEKILTVIVADHEQHSKWINTLSFLENCGARKIAACEHPTLVKEEMLKHAAEEFRHAHHLKRQITKLSSKKMDSYSLSYMLGGMSTLHYLKALDIKVCRYLEKKGLKKTYIKEVAYLLVTYAIERRAEELYPIYDSVLQKSRSRVMVKSILLEEKEHLEEMKLGLKQIPDGDVYVEHVCAVESNLCKKWLVEISKDIKIYSKSFV